MKFWVVGCEELHYVMWGDVDKLHDASYIEGIFRFRGKCAAVCRRLIDWCKKKYLPRVLRLAAYHSFSLYRQAYDGEMNYILLTDSRAAEYPIEFLQWLQARRRIKYVLVYLNPFSTSSKETLDFYHIADYVFSYDREDVDRYGMESFLTVYSDGIVEQGKAEEAENDILYFGGTNKRLEELWNCYEEIEKSGVRYEFCIVMEENEGERKYEGKIKYTGRLSYQEILQKDRKSNCLLEVLSHRQRGITLRTMEAVLLNKKLLTNNKNIVTLPFYDERFMKVFENPQDIDFEWVKKREEVKYNYHGECSPIRIIERIKEREQAETIGRRRSDAF